MAGSPTNRLSRGPDQKAVLFLSQILFMETPSVPFLLPPSFFPPMKEKKRQNIGESLEPPPPDSPIYTASVIIGMGGTNASNIEDGREKDSG